MVRYVFFIVFYYVFRCIFLHFELSILLDLFLTSTNELLFQEVILQMARR
uniref:Uncharacterized protein n=1 Tax=Anguilla anguilla TaxID=7936 RepID=A0A0E9SDU4_ANGAN